MRLILLLCLSLWQGVLHAGLNPDYDRQNVLDAVKGMEFMVAQHSQANVDSWASLYRNYRSEYPADTAINADITRINQAFLETRVRGLMGKGGLTAAERSNTISMLDSLQQSALQEDMPFLAAFAEQARLQVQSLPDYAPQAPSKSSHPVSEETPAAEVEQPAPIASPTQHPILNAEPVAPSPTQESLPLHNEVPAEQIEDGASGEPTAVPGLTVGEYTYTYLQLAIILGVMVVGAGVALGLSDTAIFYRNGLDMLLTLPLAVVAAAGISQVNDGNTVGWMLLGAGLGVIYLRSAMDNGWLMAAPVAVAKACLSVLVVVQLTSLFKPEGVTRRERIGNQVAALVWLTLLSSLAWSLRNGERVRYRRAGMTEIVQEM